MPGPGRHRTLSDFRGCRGSGPTEIGPLSGPSETENRPPTLEIADFAEKAPESRQEPLSPLTVLRPGRHRERHSLPCPRTHSRHPGGRFHRP